MEDEARKVLLQTLQQLTIQCFVLAKTAASAAVSGSLRVFTFVNNGYISLQYAKITTVKQEAFNSSSQQEC